MSKHLLYNASSLKEFSPSAMYKITCTIKVPVTALNLSNVILRIGVIGSTDEYGNDLVIKNGSYTQNEAYTDAGYHCFNGSLNDSVIVQDEYITLTGYTSNIYGTAQGGIILGSSSAGTLSSPGTLYTNVADGAISTKYITPIIYIENNTGSNISIVFDSITLEEVTTSISANGITTGVIKASQVGIGTNNILLDAIEEAIIISSPASGEMIRIGKIGSSNYGMKIKNAAGQNVFWVDDSGTAQLSNILIGSSGVITWDPSVFANGSGALGNYLTKLDSTGLYTGKIFAEQISGGNITVGLGVSGTGLIKSINYIQNTSGWMINGDGTFEFSKSASQYLKYDGTTFKIAGDVQMSATSTISWSNIASGNGKPADNATVGAPAGTNVGSTDAATIESNLSTAMTTLASMSSDNKLTPLEKQDLLREWNTILSTMDKLYLHAQSIGYSGASLSSFTSTYVTAVNTLGTYLNAGTAWSQTVRSTPSWLSNLNTDTDIVGSTFRTKFSEYYAAEESFRSSLTYRPLWITASSIAVGKASISDTTAGFFMWLNTTSLAGEMHFGNSTNYVKYADGALNIKGIVTMDTGSTISWYGIQGVPSNVLSASSEIALVGTGGVTITGNTAVKTSGGNGAWDAQAYSLESYTNGAYCSFRASQINGYIMLGLNTDPTTDASYASIDYAWYPMANGTANIYENGGDCGGGWPYSTNTIFTITYDGSNIKYMMDGVVCRTVATTANRKFYLDSSFYYLNTGLQNIRFGPMSGIPTYITSNSIESANINGGTITGTTIRTSATATSGGVVMNTSTLIVYDTNGVARVKLGYI